MAATIHRAPPQPTLNTSQAQQQTSAPVLVHRCMFTHDILKKQKKWHDGSLRFHTFNKRVMVYDEGNNLVGDLHYRSAEDFGEGLELRLDRPVLVQVEEQVSSTSTDLTKVLGRQNQDVSEGNTSQQRPTRAMLPRCNASNPQVKPKSIKELLGASQGRLGRARLPSQSPFEQRQSTTTREPPGELPLKRPRLVPDKENLPPRSTDHARLEHVRSDKRKSNEHPTTRPVVLELSSDEESGTEVLPHAAAVTKTQPCASTISKLGSDVRPLSKPATPVESGPSASRRNSHQDRRATTSLSTPSRARTRPARKILTSRSIYDIQSEDRFPAGPKSRLKFSAVKRRHVLVSASNRSGPNLRPSYSQQQHDLSQHSDASSCTSRGSAIVQTDIHELDDDLPTAVSSVKVPSLPTEELAATEDTAANIVPDVVDADSVSNAQGQRHSQSSTAVRCTAAPLQAEKANGTHRLEESLFLAHTQSQDLPVPVKPRLDTKFDAINLSQISDLLDTSNNVVIDAPRDGVQQGIPSNTSSSPSFMDFIHAEPERSQGCMRSPMAADSASACSSPQTDTSADTGKQAEPGLPRPSTTPRPFRRIVSEQVPAPRRFFSDDSDDSDIDAAFEDIAHTRKGMSPAKSPSGVCSDPVDASRVDFSDIVPSSQPVNAPSTSSPPAQDEHGEAALVPKKAEQPEGVMKPSQASLAHESGPWSPMEAFLLFDRWPVGKAKPNYGTVKKTDFSNRNVAVTSATSVGLSKKYGTFGSARFVSQR